jgi:hypothetical protein
MASNKPVPFNSPAGMVGALLSRVPPGASVTLTLPVAVDRSIELSVGIAANVRPQPQPQQTLMQQPPALDLQQYPQGYWFQQPEAD